ncbi:hypothetical protein CXB49_10550 [Chromobacterium sp. ATCC 53434]|uniref:HNH endonuclease n=1 Tax=Chromobacterium sp. (strain ATCC 53434 / SC 14030) TaxID=2059672 RepID=UPI000C75947A|nr:HNH endonuclease [Chromobacterium sp. ATCC 53434]AUH51218.1 hypothetical protein CXB49_10550 [Chromobacterium sp. ATCC 53434]
MLRLTALPLPPHAVDALNQLSELVASELDYSRRVARASQLWDAKNDRVAWKKAFSSVRSQLSIMSTGIVRCGYCGDSAADEIEHVDPKNYFPDLAFDWSNYIFSCGVCNVRKGNKYAYFDNDNNSVEFHRGRNDPVIPPPFSNSVFINPRVDDPASYLELDIGGVLNGHFLPGTFEVVPKYGVAGTTLARAEFTIRAVDLNRDLLLHARANAFDGFMARLNEYVRIRNIENISNVRRFKMVDSLRRSPHCFVFGQMRLQRRFFPEIDQLFNQAPELMDVPI